MNSDVENEVKLRKKIILNRLKDLFLEDRESKQEITLLALLKIGQDVYRDLYGT